MHQHIRNPVKERNRLKEFRQQLEEWMGAKCYLLISYFVGILLVSIEDAYIHYYCILEASFLLVMVKLHRDAFESGLFARLFFAPNTCTLKIILVRYS